MQKLLILICCMLPLFAAPIDRAFFEGDNLLHYYDQIEAEINSSVTQKLKEPKTISLERSTLKKLRELYLRKGEIAPVPTIELPSGAIGEKTLLKALYRLSDLSMEIERLQRQEEAFQQKLFNLKNRIEKETPQKDQESLLTDQMQYAFYKISKEKVAKTLQIYRELYQKELQMFEHALARAHFAKPRHAEKIIARTEEKIDTLRKRDQLVRIDKESPIHRTHKEKKQIVLNSKEIAQQTDATLTKRLEAQIVLALQSIRDKKQAQFLKTMESIDADIGKLSDTRRKRFQTLSKILITLGDQAFDTASVAIASTQMGLQGIVDSAGRFVDKTLFVYEEKAFSLRTVLLFLVIVMIGLFIAKLYKNFIDRFRRTNRIKSLSVARMIANSGYYLIILATFFIALKSIGLDMHTIFLVIGAVLLWLAFGLQSFISNYAIGILLKIDRSIRIGDHIELDPKTVGDVDDMDFRSVTIRSSDGVRTTIPNSRFIAGTFVNHSLEGECRRLSVHFSADKAIPHHLIEAKILTALSQSTIHHYRDSAHAPQMAIVDINRRIVRYALLVWVPKEMTYDMTVAQSTFLKLIHTALYPEPNAGHAPV